MLLNSHILLTALQLIKSLTLRAVLPTVTVGPDVAQSRRHISCSALEEASVLTSVILKLIYTMCNQV